MKIDAKWIVIVALLVGAYVGAGPYITVYQIKSAVEKQDAELLSDYVNFQVLRTNLKEQVNAAMMQKMSGEMSKNPFAALALGFGSKLGDMAVEAMVTPTGIMKLMSGQKLANVIKNNNEQKQVAQIQRDKLLPNADYTYDSMDKFSVWLPGNNDEKVRFVLVREGISWKLNNILIPMKL